LDEAELLGVAPWKVGLIDRWMKSKVARASRVIAVTDGIAKAIAERYGGERRRLAVVGNGANIERFKARDMLTCRRELGLPIQGRFIGFVGNLHSWQGLETLASAFARLHDGSRLLMVGDGELRRVFEERVRSLGVEDRVIMVGAVDYARVPTYVCACDVMVAPLLPKKSGDSGYSPLKIFEYLSCERPVVASRVIGLEFIERQELGMLVLPGDTEALAAGLESMLALDEAARRAMGKRGREVVVANHSWESVAVKVEKVLREVLASRAAEGSRARGEGRNG
jgi:glycosyltransferase involved in cell wall biosynthesis